MLEIKNANSRDSRRRSKSFGNAMSCFKESRDGWLLNCENNSLQKGGLSLVSRNHRLFGRAKHSLRDKECDEQSCLRRGIKGGIGTMREYKPRYCWHDDS